MYDLKQTHEILADAPILLLDDRSYRIMNVPPYDECAFPSSIYDGFIQLEDEESGEELSLILSEVDLNQLDVNIYKLVLANPKN